MPIQHDNRYLSAFWRQFTPPAGLLDVDPTADRYAGTTEAHGIDGYYLDGASWLALLAEFFECYSNGYELPI